MSGRIIPTILGKGWRYPGIEPPPTFLVFDGWPQNCHGAGGCVTYLMLMNYNEPMMRLKVHWKSNILPSWT